MVSKARVENHYGGSETPILNMAILAADSLEAFKDEVVSVEHHLP